MFLPPTYQYLDMLRPFSSPFSPWVQTCSIMCNETRAGGLWPTQWPLSLWMLYLRVSPVATADHRHNFPSWVSWINFRYKMMFHQIFFFSPLTRQGIPEGAVWFPLETNVCLQLKEKAVLGWAKGTLLWIWNIKYLTVRRTMCIVIAHQIFLKRARWAMQ